MLKVSDAILRKVYNELVRMYDGDRSEIRKAIDDIVEDNRSWESKRLHTLSRLVKVIPGDVLFGRESLAIQACKQIKDPWATETTENSPPAKSNDTTEKTYNQLTLDFSATTENSPGGQPIPSPPIADRDQPKWQEEEQLICQKFNGKREKKGWLAPQYKYFDSCGRSHTTTDPSNVPAAKIYGPYWTYRWAKPGKKYDGNLYLGATSSRKFQHFSVVWELSHDTTEVLKLLGR